MRHTKTATDQFTELGIPEADWTPAMALAVRQKWHNLDVDARVDDLRTRLAAVKLEETPSPEILAAQGFGDGEEEPDEACRKEAARLKRNATVNAWRAKNQLQAALDARELVFAARRAGKASKSGKSKSKGKPAEVAA